MTVLLIDDNPIDLMIHEKLVQRSMPEATVEKSKSGEEAIKYLDSCENPPELVLLDIKMPLMNGFEFLENINDRSYLKKLTIYMLSSSIDPKDIKMARESEVVAGFLEKPLTLEKLEKLK